MTRGHLILLAQYFQTFLYSYRAILVKLVMPVLLVKMQVNFHPKKFADFDSSSIFSRDVRFLFQTDTIPPFLALGAKGPKGPRGDIGDSYIPEHREPSEIPVVRHGKLISEHRTLNFEILLLESIEFNQTMLNLYHFLSISGERGEKGYRGLIGDKGIRGDYGWAGPKGERGSQGYKGDEGNRGDRGKFGKDGEQGGQGDKGEKGAPGYAGIDGLDGVKGEVGEDGYAGIPGPQGKSKFIKTALCSCLFYVI